MHRKGQGPITEGQPTRESPRYLKIQLFINTLVIVAALLAEEAARSVHVLWLAVEFFLVFEFGFYGVIALVFTPLLAGSLKPNVAADPRMAGV